MSDAAELYSLAQGAVAGPAKALTPSEVHGAVVGIAVGCPEKFSLQSLVDLLGADALAGSEDVEAFVRQSLTELFAEDMRFMPVIPEDDVPLSERLEALAEWTASFLAGLVTGLGEAGRTLDGLQQEAAEIVRDFSAIAGVEPGGEDAEADFMQLAEFVKVGTLLIMSELQDVDDDPAG
jgi:uncharacterized protein YgfB (UPF0149 family)